MELAALHYRACSALSRFDMEAGKTSPEYSLGWTGLNQATINQPGTKVADLRPAQRTCIIPTLCVGMQMQAWRLPRAIIATLMAPMPSLLASSGIAAQKALKRCASVCLRKWDTMKSMNARLLAGSNFCAEK